MGKGRCASVDSQICRFIDRLRYPRIAVRDRHQPAPTRTSRSESPYVCLDSWSSSPSSSDAASRPSVMGARGLVLEGLQRRASRTLFVNETPHSPGHLSRSARLSHVRSLRSYFRPNHSNIPWRHSTATARWLGVTPSMLNCSIPQDRESRIEPATLILLKSELMVREKASPAAEMLAVRVLTLELLEEVLVEAEKLRPKYVTVAIILKKRPCRPDADGYDDEVVRPMNALFFVLPPIRRDRDVVMRMGDIANDQDLHFFRGH